MPSIRDQMGRAVQVPDTPLRIISLVPSQTELMHDLGLGGRVVGITKFCVHPEAWYRSKPRVGGTKQVDLGKVRALRPDLIIGNKEENERADIEALEGEFPVWMSDVNDLAGALDMILQIGAVTGTDGAAADLADRISAGFTALRPSPSPRRAAYLIWRKPYMAAGAGTFIHDMLQRCGFENMFGSGTDRYPMVEARLRQGSGEEPRPDLVLLSSEPYPFKAAHADELRQLLPGATVLLVDGEPFCWYGSHLLRSPHYFRELFGRLGN